MSTDKTTGSADSSIPEGSGATVPPVIETTTANDDATSTGTTTPSDDEPVGSGGAKAEFRKTFALSITINLRTICKFFVGGAGYIALALGASMLLEAAATLPILLFMMTYLAVIYGVLYITFVMIVPVAVQTVDFVFDGVKTVWGKFTGLFKRKVVIVEPVAEVGDLDLGAAAAA